MKGQLKITISKEGVVDKIIVTDKIIIVNNKFVNQGYSAIRNLLAGVGATSSTITKMQFGTGNSTPAITDTTLQSPISPIKSVTTSFDDNIPSVTMYAYLLGSEANGFTLGEAGLLTPANTMVARAIYAPVEKTEDYNFTYEWVLSF